MNIKYYLYLSHNNKLNVRLAFLRFITWSLIFRFLSIDIFIVSLYITAVNKFIGTDTDRIKFKFKILSLVMIH